MIDNISKRTLDLQSTMEEGNIQVDLEHPQGTGKDKTLVLQGNPESLAELVAHGEVGELVLSRIATQIEDIREAVEKSGQELAKLAKPHSILPKYITLLIDNFDSVEEGRLSTQPRLKAGKQWRKDFKYGDIVWNGSENSLGLVVSHIEHEDHGAILCRFGDQVQRFILPEKNSQGYYEFPEGGRGSNRLEFTDIENIYIY